MGLGISLSEIKRIIRIPRGTIPTKRETIRMTGGRIREPVNAETTKKVMERAKNKCQYPRCNEKENLEIHHKNMNNNDSKLSNLMLLCPNHHTKKHKMEKGVVLKRDEFGNPTKIKAVKRNKTKPKKESAMDWLNRI